MQYGRFSDDGKEYIIENVKTPTPWINYIHNGKYFATISNNGGGISYIKNPLHGRITRYRINDVPSDRPGKYIYIKDNDTGEIWSLTWQPVGRNYKAYKVAHGFGYTRVESEIENIKSTVLYFVPADDNMEIWKAQLFNDSQTTRNLSIYAYVEFALGHALIDIINQCDDQHFNRVHFDKENNSLFATKTYWVTQNSGTQQQENQEWNQWAFFTCNLPVKQYETLRERFIGQFRNESNPAALENGNLSSQDTDYGNAVGVLRVDITLEPKELKDVVFSLGVIEKENFEELKGTAVNKYRKISTVDNAFLQVKKNWDDFLSHTKVTAPDKDVNIFLNNWTAYQAKVAFDVGRVASYYYWGISRGFGFRDTAQDVIAVTIASPEKASERIQMLARQIFSDGHSYHHFYNDGKGETTKHCDDPLWFLLAVTDYIKETGDYDILKSIEPFADGNAGTILDHMFAVYGFANRNLAKHGLPIFGRGDWNDTLDYIGGDEGGESVWGGMFYASMLNYFIELLYKIDETESVKKVEDLRDRLYKSLDDYCWDGEWYIRAFGDKDKKVGSKENEYGKIFINTQSWSVIANMPQQERLISAMDSLKKHLGTNEGPKICAPAFREIDKTIGLITRCVAGKKENGAVFCHPSAWVIQAECLLGRGNMAYEYYKQTLPNKIDPDTFMAEPYVYSQYITSDEHPSQGRASHSWQTGSAAWMYRVGFDYLLGVRASYEGLLISPSIPSHWKSYKIERVFRGTRYFIEVENPDGVESGIAKIICDGNEIEGNILPSTGKVTCNVRVILGKNKINKEINTHLHTFVVA